MLRPTGLSRRTRIALLVTSIVAILIGGALLTSNNLRGPGGATPTGSSSATDSPSATGTRTARSSDSAIGTSTIIGKDRTQQSVAPSRTAEMQVPAADGAVLATVTTPPAKTLAMLAKDSATAGSEYTVLVRVYGYGPTSGTIKTAVVLVTKSTPVGKPAKPFAFAGRNVLVRLDPTTAEALTRGGTYAGVITLRTSGDTLIPWLGDVDDGS